MNIFFTLIALIFFATSSFAGDATTSKNIDENFEELEKVLAEEDGTANSININRGYISTSFSEFNEDTTNFSNGGFISVKEYKKSTRETLDYAYKSLSAGHTELAIKTYKEILKNEPDNKFAMFGMATAYHHNKQNEKAIETYEKVLSKYPDYKDAFNNFIVLLSHENPSKAILDLKKLERKHPNFAPIPAQIGVIHHKANNQKEAVKYLTKALKIEPQNIMYRYNLAVAYDKAGDANSAKSLYKQLIIAHDKGEKIPVSENEIMDRLISLN